MTQMNGIWMVMVDPGARVPRLQCNRCQSPIGPSGRLVWRSDSDAFALGCIVLCSDDCERANRDELADVATAWRRMSIEEALFYLLHGTATVDAVLHTLDRAAVGHVIGQVASREA